MRFKSLITCALLLPTAASAGPVIWWQVPDRLIDDVPNHQAELYEEIGLVEDHDVALDRRDLAIDLAKDDRKTARSDRKDAHHDARDANKALRKAKRAGDDLLDATTTLAAAERQLLEAHDEVELKKELVAARKSHRSLEKARRARAIATRELSESMLMHIHDERGQAWHPTERYQRQLQRLSQVADERRSDWLLARVDVRERSQDHWDSSDTTLLTWLPTPVTPTVVTTTTPTLPPTTEPEELQLRRVHFDLGSATLDTTALNDVAWNAHVLRTDRDVEVVLEGHTDATGPKAFNRDLAWDRAEAIEAQLTKLGVWGSQLETVAYGESKPRVDTAHATEANRRVELRVVDNGDGLVDGTVANPDAF